MRLHTLLANVLVGLVLAGLQLNAQTADHPPTLAIVAESPSASAAANVLTAELSKRTDLHLLERSEIDKIYREQNLSSANRDFLKLGQLIGSDGLLFLNLTKEGTNRFLQAQLVAVKPAVIIGTTQTRWPLADISEWATLTVKHFASLYQKLTVLPKDALPISIVNLRSALQSKEAEEMERELTLLLIARLTHERELFVLERRRMDSLSNEKELKNVAQSPFWNGSYLLEGTLDRDGYSKERATLNIRLTPPLGGKPIDLELAGNRANLPKLAESLTQELLKALHKGSDSSTWKPGEEAQKYYEEAKWALKWGLHQEAQEAADSAWALGKQDIDCADVRIDAYQVPPDTSSVHCETLGIYEAGNDTPTKADWSKELQKLSRKSAGIFTEERRTELVVITMNKAPDQALIRSAARSLSLYEQFSHQVPTNASPLASRWDQLGVKALANTSQILQQFNWSSNFYLPASLELAELRRVARSAAQRVQESPQLKAQYFMGDELVPYDKLLPIREESNIFNLTLRYGSLWLETPQDCVSMYKHLMSSPAFSFIHEHLWFRGYNIDLLPPRLVAWNPTDQKQVGPMWASFVSGLDASSEPLLRLEAKALRLADEPDWDAIPLAFANLFNLVFQYREVFLTNNVDLLGYLQWGLSDLAGKAGPAQLHEIYLNQHLPILRAMAKEYHEKTVPAKLRENAFRKQKTFLLSRNSLDVRQWLDTFEFSRYSKSQALELLTLLANFKTNVMAANPTAHLGDGSAASKTLSLIRNVEARAADALKLADAPRRSPKPSMTNQLTQAETPKPKNIPPPAESTREKRRVLTITHSHPFPDQRDLRRLAHQELSPDFLFVAGQNWNEGKLLLDLRFTQFGNSTNASGAVELFDPATATWQHITYPTGYLYNQFSTPLLHDHALYLMGSLWPDYERDEAVFIPQLLKYDFAVRRWDNIPLPDQSLFQLSAVNDRLFASSDQSILEVGDDGRSIKVLASTRRRPAVSELDSMQALPAQKFFSAMGGLPSILVGRQLYGLKQDNWQKGALLRTAAKPELFEGATVFRTYASDQTNPEEFAYLWLLKPEDLEPQLSIKEPARPTQSVERRTNRKESPTQLSPVWQPLDGEYLTDAEVSPVKSDVYACIEHVRSVQKDGDWGFELIEGYDLKLVCLRHDFSEPVSLLLSFDRSRGKPPLRALTKMPPEFNYDGKNRLQMHLSGEQLYFTRPGADIWSIPISEIEAEIGKQIAVLKQAAEERDLAAKRKQAELLAKYDQNHNGLFDPDELIAGFTDTDFLTMEIPKIDTNKNGTLDPPELAYFDVNHNQQLEPEEQTGLISAINALSTAALSRWDVNKDGALSFNELASWIDEYGSRQGYAGRFNIIEDPNNDRLLNPLELQKLLKRRLLTVLRPRAEIAMMDPRQRPPTDPDKPEWSALLKKRVENYWHDPDSIASRPPSPKPSPPPAPPKAQTP